MEIYTIAYYTIDIQSLFKSGKSSSNRVNGNHSLSFFFAWLFWLKQEYLYISVKLEQPLLNQGSKAIKPPLDDNVRFWSNPGSTRTRHRGNFPLWRPSCGLAVVQFTVQ